MKRKGKWIAALIAVCLSFTFLAACGGGKYAIELNRNSASVYVGEELTLTAKVTLGGEETVAAVSWTSSIRRWRRWKRQSQGAESGQDDRCRDCGKGFRRVRSDGAGTLLHDLAR